MSNGPSGSVSGEWADHAVDWSASSAGRANLYAWFSALFAAELSESVIGAYQQGDAETLLAGLDAIGLTAEVERLQAAIGSWGKIPFLKQELAADFAQLFLLDVKQSAMPYASAYLDPEGQLYGKPHQQMQEFLRANGLQVHTAFKEPSDHLAVLLACMEALIRQGLETSGDSRLRAASTQVDFLRNALQTWLPTFVNQCQQLGKNTVCDFYPALTALLRAFILEDIAFLEAASELA
ncbi:molecular chaperone TorD [Diaphorobacter sp.]|uniref:molecular chaperone TorD n=1 Tax=Diaphorobacter sp. TaxID=1934310 RepID=UPI0028AC7F28|nr:molecular chaperone TorD [Diaphorobacter sp.]